MFIIIIISFFKYLFSHSVCLVELHLEWCSFARVSRGLIRLMDIRNWCNETVHSSVE